MTISFNPIQQKWNKENPYDFSGLSALYLNCTLKKSPEVSNTEALIRHSMAIMEANKVQVELIRVVDHSVAFGVYPDMTKYGWKEDAWPDIQKKVLNADILIIGAPIWLGDKSSVASMVIERLYSNSAETNNKGQFIYYGKTAGCIITGNEDGVKHCSMNLLFSLQHLGYCIPPQADAGWIGEIGPGPSYADKDSGASKNDFTNRNTTFQAWNLMHMARIMKENGGIPAWGNQPGVWEKKS